jgi:WD40 repeat protein
MNKVKLYINGEHRDFAIHLSPINSLNFNPRQKRLLEISYALNQCKADREFASYLREKHPPTSVETFLQTQDFEDNHRKYKELVNLHQPTTEENAAIERTFQGALILKTTRVNEFGKSYFTTKDSEQQEVTYSYTPCANGLRTGVLAPSEVD